MGRLTLVHVGPECMWGIDSKKIMLRYVTNGLDVLIRVCSHIKSAKMGGSSAMVSFWNFVADLGLLAT